MSQGPTHTLQMRQLRAEGGPGAFVMRIVDHRESSAHDHVFHELVYVEKGSALHQTVGGEQLLGPGHLIVMRPQVWHGYHAVKQLDLINCLVDSQLIQRLGSVLTEVSGAFDLYQRRLPRPRFEPPVVLRLPAERRSSFSQRFDAILEEQAVRQSGWQAQVRARILELLIDTARLYHQQQPAVPAAAAVAPPRWEGAVLAAAALLESSYQSQVDLAALAQQVGVSPAYLSRCFSKRMGMGVVEFTHRLRIEEACRLLRWSDMTISAVAMAVGYGEIAYFSRCFRRHTGRSPRQYRQQGPAAAPFEPGDNALQRLPVAAGE